jgi:hypothetical protein
VVAVAVGIMEAAEVLKVHLEAGKQARQVAAVQVT